MSFTARDLALGAATLLAFPLCINLTDAASSGDGRELDRPLFERGSSPTPRVPAAGR